MIDPSTLVPGVLLVVGKGPEFGRHGRVVATELQVVDRDTEQSSRTDGILLQDTAGNKFVVFPDEVSEDPLYGMIRDLLRQARDVLFTCDERQEPDSPRTFQVILHPFACDGEIVVFVNANGEKTRFDHRSKS